MTTTPHPSDAGRVSAREALAKILYENDRSTSADEPTKYHEEMADAILASGLIATPAPAAAATTTEDGDDVEAVAKALEDMLRRFAPDDRGLGEAEMACVRRARAALSSQPEGDGAGEADHE